MMPDVGFDERLRIYGRSVMLSNHTMSDIVGTSTREQKEYLMKVLEEELSFREANRKRRLLKKANFPSPKSFAGYEWNSVTMPTGLTREELVTCVFVKDARNLVLYGPVGTGKTHMCIALGTAACGMGLKVRYFTTTELVSLLSSAKEAGTVGKLMKQLEQSDMIILDEFGYVPVDRDGARLLFQVISESYEQRSLAITTNVDFSHWGAVLTDDQMAAAIIDRMAHHGHLLVFEGESYRLKHALMRA